MTSTIAAIDRFASWFRESALPLWADVAWDSTHGGFFESLDFDAQPIPGPRRVRVQSRQVYTFTQAGLRGWHTEAETLGAKGFDYLIDRACPDNALRGCGHTLSDDGSIINDKRDLYDQAFLLLACSARMEAGCKRAPVIAQNTLDFLNRDLSSPHGGWVESDAGGLPRRQNPHMHLFEAFMALYRVTGDVKWKSNANAMAALFEQHFYQPNIGVLIEFFSADLAEPDKASGEAIEPGHMMEWVWLLGAHERIVGNTDYTTEKTTLYKNAIAMRHGESGFLPDRITRRVQSSSGARRLWPQTEFIRAAFTLADSEENAFARSGSDVINALFRTYLHQPVAGLWCDKFDANGAAAAKDVPGSILYHLFEAVVETNRFKEVLGKA